MIVAHLILFHSNNHCEHSNSLKQHQWQEENHLDGCQFLFPLHTWLCAQKKCCMSTSQRGFTFTVSQTHIDRTLKQGELTALADTCVTAQVREEPVLARVGEQGGRATDWRRTVKLPFVKEKQEASCGRPSMDGWEDTAGRTQPREG